MKNGLRVWSIFWATCKWCHILGTKEVTLGPREWCYFFGPKEVRLPPLPREQCDIFWTKGGQLGTPVSNGTFFAFVSLFVFDWLQIRIIWRPLKSQINQLKSIYLDKSGWIGNKIQKSNCKKLDQTLWNQTGYQMSNKACNDGVTFLCNLL